MNYIGKTTIQNIIREYIHVLYMCVYKYMYVNMCILLVCKTIYVTLYTNKMTNVSDTSTMKIYS